MFEKEKIDEIVSSYKDFKIATICSHSALQIFHGAKQEKIKTIGDCYMAAAGIQSGLGKPIIPNAGAVKPAIRRMPFAR